MNYVSITGSKLPTGTSSVCADIQLSPASLHNVQGDDCDFWLFLSNFKFTDTRYDWLLLSPWRNFWMIECLRSFPWKPLQVPIFFKIITSWTTFSASFIFSVSKSDINDYLIHWLIKKRKQNKKQKTHTHTNDSSSPMMYRNNYSVIDISIKPTKKQLNFNFTPEL